MSVLMQKHLQAVEVCAETGVDVWLVFVRETEIAGDPALPLLFDGQLTWPSALLFFANGARVAIVGQLDDGPIRAAGLFTEVRTYVEGIGAQLIDVLDAHQPQRIGINYAPDDVLADGLSHGMYLRLRRLLKDTPHLQRLESAAPIAAAVRGRKTTLEIERICAAIEVGDRIFEDIGRSARVGVSELELQAVAQDRAAELGVGLAWQRKMCPIVNAGAASGAGHAWPSAEVKLAAGDVLHVDFGVVVDGYCSDIQRCWYVLRPGESRPPVAVRRAFETVARAIASARAALLPGALCWTVDAAARGVLAEAGYPAYAHATGHEVGQCAHDGGGILGPRWPRYGQAPHKKVEIGNVFTIEPSILKVGPHGAVGLEEIVVVEAAGARFLSTPQQHLWLLPSNAVR